MSEKRLECLEVQNLALVCAMASIASVLRTHMIDGDAVMEAAKDQAWKQLRSQLDENELRRADDVIGVIFHPRWGRRPRGPDRP